MFDKAPLESQDLFLSHVMVGCDVGLALEAAS